jgi:hypothetical protein
MTQLLKLKVLEYSELQLSSLCNGKDAAVPLPMIAMPLVATELAGGRSPVTPTLNASVPFPPSTVLILVTFSPHQRLLSALRSLFPDLLFVRSRSEPVSLGAVSRTD